MYKYSEKKLKDVEKYNAENYDRLTFRMKKEESKTIREAAAAAGMSINNYIYTAVMEKLNK